MKSFDEHLQASVASHGHLCAGQILGVRMARAGLRELGIDEPEKCRDLITFIENDRCLADAISSVTACKLGRRRLKYRDYGKSAATFLNLATGKAARVSSTRWIAPPEGADLRAYFDTLPDSEIFKIEYVAVTLPPEDMPGKPVEKAVCGRCGEIITDKRHVTRGRETLCRSCAGESYYTVLP